MQAAIINLFKYRAVEIGTVVGCISSLVSPNGNPLLGAMFGMIFTAIYNPLLVVVPVVHLSERLYPSNNSITNQVKLKFTFDDKEDKDKDKNIHNHADDTPIRDETE